jgi:hypothetical protein
MAAVFLAGVGATALGGELAAGVLPALAVVVPVEANLREASPDILGGLLGEGDPDPSANNLSEGKGLGIPPAQVFQDLSGGERAAFQADFVVHKREDPCGFLLRSLSRKRIRRGCCWGLEGFAPLLIRTELEP